MSENVALVKNKQTSFNKSVQNYKSLLKKGAIKISDKAPLKRSTKPERGIVYLGNIPHGFYEDQMKEYFSQFGFVSRLRLARSQNTGKSRGFAFIEFRVPEVAQIVAETMDRYLMGKRLLKAQYIAPSEQHGKYFIGKAYSRTNYLKKTNRNIQINNVNAEISEAQNAGIARRILGHINKVKKRLANRGIKYEFVCVDIPDNLKKPESKIADSDDDDQSELASEESDDEIVFQPPLRLKTIVKQKSTKAKSKVVSKRNESAGKVQKVIVGGVSKKLIKKPNQTKGLGNKKLDLLKKTALNSSQVTFKVAAEMKKKNRKSKQT